jgi:outer membrane protein OmpA-like peptidoglycan-associated protein
MIRKNCRGKVGSLFIIALFLLPLHTGGAVEFAYRMRQGDQYRILSIVDERIYVNGRYNHSARILNKIAAKVVDTKEGWGQIDATFLTSESREGNTTIFELSQEYESLFWRSVKGHYDIAPSYYMPVVRSVPTFPDGPLEVGDSWSAVGEEVHDLRHGYGIPEPFQFPIQVHYRYLGPNTYNGEKAELISIQYSILHRTDSSYARYQFYPQRISGFSDQLLYWDSKNGRPFGYEEKFSIIFDLSNGDSYEFTGTAHAQVVEASSMDKESVKEDLERRIREEEIADAGVRIGDDGVIISLENVQFLPDSATPLAGELEKLDRVASLLRLYPDRDILVTGHTALAGTREGRMALSLERARAVAEFLKSELGIGDDRLMIDGKGAEEPIAPNDTQEGMRKNRRVEITILEN